MNNLLLANQELHSSSYRVDDNGQWERSTVTYLEDDSNFA